MRKLYALLEQLEKNVPNYEMLNEKVSQSPIWWHIEHSLLSISKVTDSIINSNPTEYKWEYNFIRIVVLTMKKIPRGRAKSPEIVNPKEKLDSNTLLAHITETRAKIESLKDVPRDKFFKHPFFGHLKLNQTIKFLEIHTQHHLNIIEDIKGGK